MRRDTKTGEPELLDKKAKSSLKVKQGKKIKLGTLPLTVPDKASEKSCHPLVERGLPYHIGPVPVLREKSFPFHPKAQVGRLESRGGGGNVHMGRKEWPTWSPRSVTTKG